MDGLDSVQIEKVQTFLSVTNSSDLSVAISALESVNYDLDRAIMTWMEETQGESSYRQTLPPQPTSDSQPSSIFSLFTWPIRFILGLVIKVLSVPGYFFSSYRAIGNGDGRNAPSGTDHNFKEQFEKQYGLVHPTFLEIKYSQALEKAKQEVKFLAVYLHSDEHESSDEFCGNTLTSPELISFFTEHDILFWGGNVNYTEGYQVSVALQSSGFPFVALISLRPRSSESGGYKMSVLERLEGITTPQEIQRKFLSQISRINPELTVLRSERAEQEASRSLREQQDFAYQQSLLADQEKARRLKEQKEAEIREKDRQTQELERNALNAKYRSLYISLLKNQLPCEPEPGEPGLSRFSIRLVNGERVIRRFRGDQTVLDLYNFTETIIPADNWAPSTPTSESIRSLPEDYVHKFGFRLTSYPRLVFEPTLEQLKEVKGLSAGANLLVESIDVE